MISPAAFASRAESLGFSSTSSIALRSPTSRGRKNVELSAPVRLVLWYAHSNDARSDATTRSQAIAMPNPPAAAMPSTAAIKGLGARRTSEMALWMYSSTCLKLSPYPRGGPAPSGWR